MLCAKEGLFSVLGLNKYIIKIVSDLPEMMMTRK